MPASPHRRHHTCRRIDDECDLRGEHLEGVGHFALIIVPVIDAANAADDMTKATLGNVGVDARSA